MKIVPIPPCSLSPDLIMLEQRIEEEMYRLCGVPDFLMVREPSTARETLLTIKNQREKARIIDETR